MTADQTSSEWNGGDNTGTVAPLPKKSHHKKATAAPVSKATGNAPDALGAARRTRIVLEDNDQIGPSGQFFGADGKGYMLRPGEEADVPDSILNILDTAIMSVPITDVSQTVVGYRDRLRFPYRVITARRGA